MSDISLNDLNILIALQEHPLASASTLAKIVEVSQPTVVARLRELREKIALYNVNTDLNLSTLELEICNVILDISSLENVRFIEKLCKIHPYTLYRARKFGQSSGLLIQFRIPTGTNSLIRNTMKLLMDQHQITNFRLLNKAVDKIPSVYSKNSFLALNRNSKKWEFDWDFWRERLASSSEIIPKSNSDGSILMKLQQLDIELLGQLTLNARQKNSEIIRRLGLDPDSPGIRQKVSRRLKFLKEKAILNYRCFFNWEVFDSHHTFLFHCKASRKESARLYNNLKENTIPFQSTFTIIDGGFLWAVQAPPSHFSHISSIVWEYSTEQELVLIDYKSSMVYGLWPATFNAEHHKWKISIMKPEEVLTQLNF